MPDDQEALGVDVNYLNAPWNFRRAEHAEGRGDWYVAFLRKVTETPE